MALRVLLLAQPPPPVTDHRSPHGAGGGAQGKCSLVGESGLFVHLLEASAVCPCGGHSPAGADRLHMQSCPPGCPEGTPPPSPAHMPWDGAPQGARGFRITERHTSGALQFSVFCPRGSSCHAPLVLQPAGLPVQAAQDLRGEQHRHTERGSHTRRDKGEHSRQGGGAQQGRRGNQNSGNREPEWRGWWSVRMGGSDNKRAGLASQPRRYRVPGQPLLNRHQVGGVSRIPDGLFAQQERESIKGRPAVREKRTYGGRPGRPGVEEQGTWASHTQKHSEAGYRQPVDRGTWTAQKQSNDPGNNQHILNTPTIGPAADGTPCHIQHSPNTPTTGLRGRGNDTSKSTGRSGRQKAATRRNMRREERVTVQGPVKEQQPDGMSHRGAGAQDSATWPRPLGHHFPQRGDPATLHRCLMTGDYTLHTSQPPQEHPPSGHMQRSF